MDSEEMANNVKESWQKIRKLNDVDDEATCFYTFIKTFHSNNKKLFSDTSFINIVDSRFKCKSNQPTLVYPGSFSCVGIPGIAINKNIFLTFSQFDVPQIVLTLVGCYYLFNLEYPNPAKYIYNLLERELIKLKKPTIKVTKSYELSIKNLYSKLIG